MQIFPVKIYNTSSPAGIDAEIAKIQSKIAAISWVDTIFGRANIQRRALGENEVSNSLASTAKKERYVFYPQGRKLDQDIDLSFSDAYPSVIYFYLRDPINVAANKGWNFGEEQTQVAQPISMIFNCDMRKLDPARSDNFSEELKITILSALDKVPRIELTNVYESGGAVLKDFTVNDGLLNFTRYPYCALRFDMVCTYPAFPEDGNGAFNPNIYNDNSRSATTVNSSIGSSNLN
jgi:hypothetical protein